MSAGAYLVGVLAVLVAGAPVAIAAVRLRARLLPGSTGAPARLGEVVIGFAIVTVTSEVLGTVGAFRGVVLVVALAAAGCALAVAAGRGAVDATVPRAVPGSPVGRVGAVAAIATGALLAGQWATHTAAALGRGIVHTDSLQYHLTHAARFAQDGWLSRPHYVTTEFPHAFHPANSELVHALGMEVFGRDILSPVLGLGWLAFALLAAWCVGRPRGVAPLTLMAVAVLLATPRVASDSAGTASNDIVAIGLLLAAAAFLPVAPLAPDREPGSITLAGLAAGLAAGTKLTALAPVGGLTVGVLLSCGSGQRLRTTVRWLVPLFLAGGYWYLRNLVRTGTPLPGAALPLLPHPRFAVVDDVGFSFGDYLFDSTVWRDWYVPGLRLTLGGLWPLTFAAVAAGALGGIAAFRRDRALAALGLAALLGSVAYVVTPTTALGPPGRPLLFASNVMYVTPALALGLVLVPLVAPARRAWTLAVLAVSGVLVVNGFVARKLPSWNLDHLGVGVAATVASAGAVVLAAVLLGRPSRRPPRAALVAAGVVAVLVLLAGGFVVGRRYVDRRYDDDPVAQWANTLDGARIALAGDASQFTLYGDELDNYVQYVGVRGDHGEFHETADCTSWRALLRRDRYEWVVLRDGYVKVADRQVPWTETDPAAELVLDAAGTRVFQFDPDVADPGC